MNYYLLFLRGFTALFIVTGACHRLLNEYDQAIFDMVMTILVFLIDWRLCHGGEE